MTSEPHYSCEITRLGPVYLWWSEYNDLAVVGPKQGAWGGDNLYRCDVHPEWVSDDDEREHAMSHGFYVDRFVTFRYLSGGPR